MLAVWQGDQGTPAHLIPLAQDIGRRVLRRWQRLGRPAAGFAEIACAELAATLPGLVADSAAWVAELAACDDLPLRRSASTRAFGEPPVRLWQRACTDADLCRGGACKGGKPLDCDDANTCTQDLCDPAKGCFYQKIVDQTPCNDGDQCTQSDKCQGGVCLRILHILQNIKL
ncbi:MAG: hypothetical protein EXR79_14420 [Myxococcales bacterium]|nr:hypothetical protein [Myxococcales bacterium]